MCIRQVFTLWQPRYSVIVPSLMWYAIRCSSQKAITTCACSGSAQNSGAAACCSSSAILCSLADRSKPPPDVIQFRFECLQPPVGLFHVILLRLLVRFVLVVPACVVWIAYQVVPWPSVLVFRRSVHLQTHVGRRGPGRRWSRLSPRTAPAS